MTAIVRGDALAIPLRDESVDLIVTSPPYFGQRSYRDGGEHYDGQIGSEPTPQEFLEALWAVTRECWRILKPTGSMFVNLGDKRSGSGAPGTTSGLGGAPQGNRTGMSAGSPERNVRAPGRAQYVKAAFGRAKSKQLLPHRYAIGCEDGLADPEGIGWIMRQDLVWLKPNGLPESVKDRTRDAHEYWFHLCKQGDYFAAIDEIREPHGPDQHRQRNITVTGWESGEGTKHRSGTRNPEMFNPLGKLPSSVWSIATEPLKVPAELGVEHFAAFPSEWPRRLVLGFSPTGICIACEQPRRPVLDVRQEPYRAAGSSGRPKRQDLDGGHSDNGFNGVGYPQTAKSVAITGYACACPTPDAPTRPAVVLDPFGGTGTTAMVARALGRTGISLDLSSDYCRLARWRVFESTGAAKVADRTAGERQGALL